MFNAFLEPCYPCGIGTNENRVIAAVALPSTIPPAAPKVTDYSIRRQQVALLSSVYASLCTSRYPAQDSRPSGSLLLSRKELSSSASCRFIPAHCNRLHPLHALSTPVATCSVIRHPAGSSQESFTPLVLTTLDFLTTRPRKVHFRSSLGCAPAQVFLALFLQRSPPRLLTIAAWR